MWEETTKFCQMNDETNICRVETYYICTHKSQPQSTSSLISQQARSFWLYIIVFVVGMLSVMLLKT